MLITILTTSLNLFIDISHDQFVRDHPVKSRERDFLKISSIPMSFFTTERTQKWTDHRMVILIPFWVFVFCFGIKMTHSRSLVIVLLRCLGWWYLICDSYTNFLFWPLSQVLFVCVCTWPLPEAVLQFDWRFMIETWEDQIIP